MAWITLQQGSVFGCSGVCGVGVTMECVHLRGSVTCVVWEALGFGRGPFYIFFCGHLRSAFGMHQLWGLGMPGPCLLLWVGG